ncbi:hypothetical protein [Undibacterium curvum]|uniref:Uncharacterized protein n=1 Tax=Undibacterium curvum TaxID=2762294 RepID=A0ABR7A3L2_9BURK|nr:hypothetical protein [Undibacterium curvum]MBC3931496.1 hypothetical protein [Undibacterium curvum]
MDVKYESESSIQNTFKSIAERFPFAVGKKLLSDLFIPTKLGWSNTLINLRNFDESKAVKHAGKILLNSFINHTLAGDKLVKLYGFEKMPHLAEFKKAINERALEIDVPQNAFKDKLPWAVCDSEVLKLNEQKAPQLCEIKRVGSAVYFIFCSVRSFHERVELEKSLFEEAEREKLEDFSEIIGIRPVRRQAFDAVVIHLDRDLVELRVDSPLGLPVDQRKHAADNLRFIFDALSIENFGYGPFGTAPKNFVKIITNLYNEKSEGKVFELGFTANAKESSSNNGAKLLRKKGQDLRSDKFHTGGKGAVDSIDPYTIGVEWEHVNFNGRPKLIVPGSVRMLYASPIIFPEVLIRDCYSEDEFKFVLSKIDKYIA